MALEGDLDVTVRGATVTFVFTVTNNGPDPVNLTFTSGRTADFVVFEDGAEIWRWSADKVFTQAVHDATLEPGEVAIHEETWNDPEPGEYRVVATLESSPGVRTEQQFTVR